MKGHIRKRGNKYCIVIDIGPDPETGKEDRNGFLDIRQKKKHRLMLRRRLQS